MFKLRLLDGNRDPVVPQPVNFDVFHNIPPAYKHEYRTDWNVTTAGVYYLDVLRDDTIDPASFMIY